MKKQIAVLMAAATAVTTVAPVVANADVNTDKLSVAQITDRVEKALDTKYDAKDMDGIKLPDGVTVKDYMNSRYIVLVTNGETEEKLGKTGFKRYDESKYNNYADFTAVVDTDAAGDDVIVKKGDDKYFVVDNASKLSVYLEENMDNEKVKVSIIDKGIADGKSYRETDNKYYVTAPATGEEIDEDNEVSLQDAAEQLFNSVETGETTFVDTLKINGEKFVDGEEHVAGKSLSDIKDVTEIELTLTGGETFTLEAGDDAFDFGTARDADGNEIKLHQKDKNDSNSGWSISDNSENVLKDIVKFDVEEDDDDETNKVDIGNGDTDVLSVQNVVEEIIELNNIYTRENGYNQEGADFLNGLIGAATTTTPDFQFNFRGHTYLLAKDGKEVKNADDAKAAIHVDKKKDKDLIKKDGTGYKLVFNVDVIDANDKEVAKTIQFVVKGEKQADLFDVLRDLRAGIETGREVVAGHFTKLFGADRYATAIAISQEQFDPNEADTVVIVGGEANLDGLASAPLASAKNATVLLADKKNGLNKATLNEIERACKKLERKTVYIVGGENSVPTSVEKQLEEQFKAVPLRVSGADRYDTSVEVARRLRYDGQVNDRIFLVGGNGEADAMSIAPVAATKTKVDHVIGLDSDNEVMESKNKFVSPIIVVNKNGINRNTREFIANKNNTEDNNNISTEKAYLVGGESSLSTQIFRDLGYADVTDRTRLAGADRFDTNFEIVEEFYANKSELTNNASDNTKLKNAKIMVDGAVYTSGDNKYLVDAMAAGSFAASNNAPIILTGSSLTGDQTDMLKKDGILDEQRSGIYQVGGVVSTDVMKTVVDKLEL